MGGGHKPDRLLATCRLAACDSQQPASWLVVQSVLCLHHCAAAQCTCLALGLSPVPIGMPATDILLYTMCLSASQPQQMCRTLPPGLAMDSSPQRPFCACCPNHRWPLSHTLECTAGPLDLCMVCRGHHPVSGHFPAVTAAHLEPFICHLTFSKILSTGYDMHNSSGVAILSTYLLRQHQDCAKPQGTRAASRTASVLRLCSMHML